MRPKPSLQDFYSTAIEGRDPDAMFAFATWPRVHDAEPVADCPHHPLSTFVRTCQRSRIRPQRSTRDIATKVVGCGNTTGAKTNKLKRSGLTSRPAELVDAPLIEKCFASRECCVVDTSMVTKYSFFVLQVLRAWVDPLLKQQPDVEQDVVMLGAGAPVRLRTVGTDPCEVRPRAPTDPVFRSAAVRCR
jgi:hypothetical protein